jgi:hypothetical protein
MAWQRKIPFGYAMENGEIQCNTTESEAVRDIFRRYLNGAAYSKIADEMVHQGIHYHQHTAEWNKHMVKRILENERYLGEKGYPAIIDQATYMNAQLLRGSKTDYAPCPDYILPIREKAICGVCGANMLRDIKANGNPRWHCENSDCGNRLYITDEALRDALAERLIALASNPSLLDWPVPRSSGDDHTLEVVRIENEITRELNKAAPSVDYTRMLILACAAEKYAGLYDRTPHRRIQRLQARFVSRPIDNTTCDALLETAVSGIAFESSGKLSLRLVNGINYTDAGKEN